MNRVNMKIENVIRGDALNVVLVSDDAAYKAIVTLHVDGSIDWLAMFDGYVATCGARAMLMGLTISDELRLMLPYDALVALQEGMQSKAQAA